MLWFRPSTSSLDMLSSAVCMLSSEASTSPRAVLSVSLPWFGQFAYAFAHADEVHLIERCGNAVQLLRRRVYATERFRRARYKHSAQRYHGQRYYCRADEHRLRAQPGAILRRRTAPRSRRLFSSAVQSPRRRLAGAAAVTGAVSICASSLYLWGYRFS